MSDYAAFLASKVPIVPSSGIDVAPDDIHPSLFPFQRDLVRWALRKGRSAIFATTGGGMVKCAERRGCWEHRAPPLTYRPVVTRRWLVAIMKPQKERIKLVCAECGASFERLPSQLGRNRGRFCSVACKGVAQRRGSVLHCAFCDAAFYRHTAEQDIGVKANQFCSRRCYDEWRATRRSPDTYPKVGTTHAHRAVAETWLGRRLSPSEVVHHIDLDKHNFDPSNLAVFPDQATHLRCHNGGMSDDELRGFSLVQGRGRPE